MQKSDSQYIMFMILILVLSIPFYILGAFFPFEGLLFGLPISFLMIFVPFFLALIYVRKENDTKGIVLLFKSIFDIRKAASWAVIFSIVCMPLVACLSYITMEFFSLSLPTEIVYFSKEISLMLILYFLGAISEEFGWTYILTEPLVKTCGSVYARILIGSVWALWHVLPWSWLYPIWWVAGMCILNVLMRTAMVYVYMYGGKSLFTGLVFHTMINVSMSTFPNGGSHMNPWIFSGWMAFVLIVMRLFIKKKEKAFKY